ncbi:hypothetical protein BDN72DRAFT_57773 [Pluteus cervinus]|uniref:Uncharacterized protein n=1 Tax=Pluteus cervinus TaxID=181527 RepID=A0ACD3BA55_9AGAR|nr:hypothetical protein BDN72DRAFT_57773 [Pluteus cervinus]
MSSPRPEPRYFGYMDSPGQETTPIASTSQLSPGGSYGATAMPQATTSNRSPSPTHREQQPRKAQRPKYGLSHIFLSFVCLGIPYIFLKHNPYQPLDAESRSRVVTPLFFLAAGTIFLDVIILSASVTWLTLPGLEDSAHVADVFAAIFTTLSLSSAVFAIMEYKETSKRVRQGSNRDDDARMHMARSVIFSLPVIFLEYSIIAFVTAVVLYLVKD